MIVLKSEQIMRAESEHGARTFMDVIDNCYSFFLHPYPLLPISVIP